jgi:chromosome segregation ATPase
MKIVELKSENIKRVKAVEIIPKDNVVIISGKNDQGKSSILDSIWYALEGKGSLKDTPMPIRKGENKAEVKLTLDDFIVTRNWTANDKSYLKVTNREGLAYNSPQELLDSFIGKLAFDPLEFAGMKEKEQRDLLLEITGIDIDSFDNKIGVLKEERRMQGQKVKLLSGRREEVTIKDLPELLILTTDIQNEYEKAIQNNNLINSIEQDLEIHKKHLKDILEQVEELQDKIKANENYLTALKYIKVDDIKQKMNKAEAINEQIKIRSRNKTADKEQSEAQKVYDNYTKKIDEVIEGKQTALSNAKMPITGLSINDTGVIYNDIPFGQLSSSEQLKVSLSIAIALNPKLKVIRIVDGSLLDDDNMELIKGIAKDNDYQIWVERINDTGELCFIIEDGELVDKKG